MEVERLQSEVGAVRARLKFAEDSLVEQRGQNLQMEEAMAALETELLAGTRRREAAEARRSDEVTLCKSKRAKKLKS